MSDNQKNLTLKFNADLGDTPKAIETITKAFEGTDAVIKGIAVTSKDSFNTVTGAAFKSFESIVKLTVASKESIAQVKILADELNKAHLPSSSVINSSLAQDTAKDLAAQKAAMAEKLAAQKALGAELTRDVNYSLQQRLAAERNYITAQKALGAELNRDVKFNTQQRLAAEKEYLAQVAALQQRRSQIFTSGLSEAQSKLQSDIAIQKALQQEGANSITAIKLRQAEAERQIQRKLATDLNAINARFQAGTVSWIQSAGERNVLLAQSRERILSLNQATVDNVRAIEAQNQANSSSVTWHRNIFLRVAEIIGIYRLENAAINSILNSIRSIPNIGIQLEATEATLQAVTKSTGAVGSIMKALDEESLRTGINIATLRETFRTFSASTSIAGEKLSTTWKIFTDLNSVITTLHLSADKANLVFLAVSQIFNKSRVQSEELVKQLGNLLPGAFGAFAASFKKANGEVGISTQELAQMLKKGMVTAHKTMADFTAFLSDKFAQGFEQASHGVNANIGRMESSFTHLGEAIYTTTSGALNSVIKSFTTFIDYLTKTVEGTTALSTALNTLTYVAFGAFISAGFKAIEMVKSFITTMVSFTAATTTANASLVLSARGADALALALGFFKSPVIIVAGIAAITKAIYDMTQQFVPAEEGVRRILDSLSAAKAIKDAENNKELTLQLKVDDSSAVKEAQGFLAKLQEELARAEHSFAEIDPLTGKTNFEIARTRGWVENAKKALEEVKNTAKIKAETEFDIQQLEKSVSAKIVDQTAINALTAQNKLVEAAKAQFEFTEREHINLAQSRIAQLKELRDKDYSEEIADLQKFLSNEEIIRREAIAKAQLAQDKPSTAVASGARAAAKELSEILADTLRDSENVSTSIKNNIQELQTTSLEKLKDVTTNEATNYTKQYSVVRDYYNSKIDLIDKDVAVQLEALYQAQEIARQYHNIAKQKEIDDKITALAGRQASENSPAISGTGDKANLEAAKEYHALLSSIDAKELEMKQTLLNTALTAEEVFKRDLEKLDNLYASVNSKGVKILSDLEYLQSLSKLNLNFNIAKDIELSAPINKAIPALARYDEYAKKILTSTKQIGDISGTVYNAALKGVNLLVGTFEKLSIAQQKFNNESKNFQESSRAALEGIVFAKYDDENKRVQDLHNLRVSNAAIEQKIADDYTSSQLEAGRLLIGSTAALFDQKSTAAKALHAIETGIATAEIVMNAAKLASELGLLPVKAAGAVINAGANGDGYTAVPRMAAVAAFVAGILAAVGAAVTSFSGGGGDTSSSSSESFKAAGADTGTVLGDATASSQSLTRIGDLLKSIHAAEYVELRGINSGVNKLSVSINDTVTQLFQSGSLSDAIAAKSVGAHLGSSVGASSGGDPIMSLVSSLFSKGSTSKEVISGGIGLAPINFGEILKGAIVAANQYITTATTTSGSGGIFGLGGSKSKTTIDIQLTALDETTTSGLTKIFKTLAYNFIDLGDALGVTVADKLKDITTQMTAIDIHGLTGEDAAKKISGAISAIADDAALTLFTAFKGFQKLGEGMFETVTRLVIQMGVVHNSFKMLGITFQGTIEEGVLLSDTLSKVVGNIEELRTAFEDFFSKFYTEAEQQKYQFESLSSILQSMNVILPETRMGWKVLVQTMLAGGQATAELAGNLLKLSNNADTFYTALEKTQSALITGLFGEVQSKVDTIISNANKQQAILNQHPEFVDVGVRAGNTTSDVQAAIANYLQTSGRTMQSLLDWISANPSARADIDAFLALAASNTQNDITPQAATQQVSAEQAVVNTFIEALTAILTKATITLTALINNPSTQFSAIDSYITTTLAASKAAFDSALADLDKLYDSITTGIQNKLLEINDTIATINISLIKNSSARMAAETALYNLQKARYTSEFTKVISGETFQQKYDREIAAINSLQSLIQSRYDKEVAQINTVMSAIDAIHAHVKELLVDPALSPLTNAQRLAEAGKQFQETISAAQGGDTTALGNVNTALDKYLTEARAFYASSADYQAIFYAATQQANSLTAGTLTVDQQIAQATANTVKELQDLQLELNKLDSQKTAQLNQARVDLRSNFDRLNSSFLLGIQRLIDVMAPGNGINVGANPGNSGFTGSVGAIRDVASAYQSVLGRAPEAEGSNYWASMLDTGALSVVNLARTIAESAASFTAADIANYTGVVPQSALIQSVANAKAWLATHSFASGAAFSSGVVSRPTLFNIGQMGERGSEGILPLANVKGRLGVHATIGGAGDARNELIQEIRALRHEVETLRKENRENVGDMVVATYDAHSQTANTIAGATISSTDKAIWVEKSKPVLV